jgi:hypothetical protein
MPSKRQTHYVVKTVKTEDGILVVTTTTGEVITVPSNMDVCPGMTFVVTDDA